MSDRSYEEWKENDMRTELFAESMEELAEKKMLLDVLRDAMDSLMPEERELAVKVFGEEMSVYEYARIKGGNRRTLAFRKKRCWKNCVIFSGNRELMCDSQSLISGANVDLSKTLQTASAKEFHHIFPDKFLQHQGKKIVCR